MCMFSYYFLLFKYILYSTLHFSFLLNFPPAPTSFLKYSKNIMVYNYGNHSATSSKSKKHGITIWYCCCISVRVLKSRNSQSRTQRRLNSHTVVFVLLQELLVSNILKKKKPEYKHVGRTVLKTSCYAKYQMF